jgi:uncharacterized membrane protein YfcA
LILAGVVSGVVGGMGMGGGTLLIPILTIFLTFEQKNAQAINLLVFIPMALVALIIHIKNKLVDLKVGVPIICSGVIFSIGGSMLAGLLGNKILQKIFGVFLLGIGINQSIHSIILLVKKHKKDNNKGIKLNIFIKK